METSEPPIRPDQAPATGADVSVGELTSAPPSRRRGRRLTFLIPLFALAYIGYVVRLPYFVIAPGPASDVEPLIHIQDHQTYQSDGHLLLTAVTLQQPNVYQAVGAWLSPSESVVPERDILGPGQTPQQETQVALSQMDTSKIDAAVVALRKYANYPAEHGDGVLVEDVFPGTPSDGKLFAGDLITDMDGAKVDSVELVSTKIKEVGVGHPLHFTVTAGGQTRQVTVAPVLVKDVSYPIIGVSLVESFPFPLTIDSGDIGGPSAGLMWTLGLIDVLTPGDLTGGHTIAGTGTIAPDGTVGPIGGIEQKVVAAERAGATAFFAPATEASDARSVAHDMTIVSVKTYTDAVQYLMAHS
jgi:PDZ domain-containing protein